MFYAVQVMAVKEAEADDAGNAVGSLTAVLAEKDAVRPQLLLGTTVSLQEKLSFMEVCLEDGRVSLADCICAGRLQQHC
jgi:hypothetical protein